MPSADIVWRADGTPVSPQFDDIYRNAGAHGAGGLAQARHVFLRGCGLLPTAGAVPAWQGAPHWAVLELGFGLGLNFLATWDAWRRDPGRPTRLNYSAVEAFLPEPADLLRSAAPFAPLGDLAQELAARWHGLLPGVHRLVFANGRVCLTLAVGEAPAALHQLAGRHDSLYLDGFSPARNPAMWSLPTLKAAVRQLRRGARAATWCVAADVRARLRQLGFAVERRPGLPPKRHALQAHYDPAWRIRRRERSDHVVYCGAPARCAVIGAGIAGASVAWSLAQRGWSVRVLDAAHAPAAGASGVPVGLVMPHVSFDDCLLSQLSRAGVQATFSRARALLVAGRDFAVTGLLERHAPSQRRLPALWHKLASSEAMRPATLDHTQEVTHAKAQAAALRLSAAQPALWHANAGWLLPAMLIKAMLAAPGIAWQGGARVHTLRRRDSIWQLMGQEGSVLAEAELVVIAAGWQSTALLGADANLPLQALRGQVTHGPMALLKATPDAPPPFPVVGTGHFVAGVPTRRGAVWQTGATFQRDRCDTRPQPQDNTYNLRQLAQLLPQAADQLSALERSPALSGWAGVRATLPDHLPAVGAWLPGQRPFMRSVSEPNKRTTSLLPLHVCTGFGARGMTLAVLCAELLAASLHDEPLAVTQKLAAQLSANRYQPRKSGN